MSGSWGHTLQKLSDEQQANLPEYARHCAPGGRRCSQATTHLATYQYITGQSGRMSWARKRICDTHAERFRAKHNLPAPEVQPTPKHALERILEGGTS